MSIPIGSVTAQAVAGAAVSELGVAVAKKALKQEAIEGAGAVRLIQEAGKVDDSPADAQRGRRVDVYA
jgi:hypothetical protein